MRTSLLSSARCSILPTALAAAVLSACSTPPSRQDIGIVSGAVVGGVVGSVMTGGSTVGTAAGAAGGALVGRELTKGTSTAQKP